MAVLLLTENVLEPVDVVTESAVDGPGDRELLEMGEDPPTEDTMGGAVEDALEEILGDTADTPWSGGDRAPDFTNVLNSAGVRPTTRLYSMHGCPKSSWFV